MFFISSKKLFSFSRYSIFCDFFPFDTFQVQRDKWKWNNLCHEWTCRCTFWNNSKTALHYIIKLGQIIYNE